MLFNKPKLKDEPASFNEPGQTPLIIWLEIGALDVDRAVGFYKNVFGVNIEIRSLFDKRVGFFEKKNGGPGICIMEKERISISDSIKPTFFVNIMHEAIDKVVANGGKIILAPSLLKQENNKGEVLIGANLIDNQIGYIAEVMDTEGNLILLYAHY